jgi:hypothetical protein
MAAIVLRTHQITEQILQQMEVLIVYVISSDILLLLTGNLRVSSRENIICRFYHYQLQVKYEFRRIHLPNAPEP